LTRREASQLAQGERPFDSLTPFDSQSARDAREPLAQGEARAKRQLAQGGRNDKAEIKNEIERARIEMSETLGEIQERLRPDHLIQQAKDTVTDAATGKVRNIMHSAGERATMVADQTKYAGRNVADYVRTHPVQMALVAGSVAWWLLRGRDRSDDWEGASEGWQDTGHRFDTDAGFGEDRSVRERVGEYASTARETVGEYAASAKGYAASARDTMSDAAEAARSRTREASERARLAAQSASVRAQHTWRRASTSVDDWVHEYPLAAGAIAVAVGAAVGLSVPSTEIENRALGEQRDLALEKARLAANQIKENVSQKVQDVAESVLDVTEATPTGPTTEPSQGRV
jgi:ElaB/YqjD/DUF883 family membrane-anchored ribosome-binding protein